MVQVQVQVFSELSGNIKVGGEGHICDWTLTGESRLSVGLASAGIGTVMISVADRNCLAYTRSSMSLYQQLL